MICHCLYTPAEHWCCKRRLWLPRHMATAVTKPSAPSMAIPLCPISDSSAETFKAALCSISKNHRLLVRCNNQLLAVIMWFVVDWPQGIQADGDPTPQHCMSLNHPRPKHNFDVRLHPFRVSHMLFAASENSMQLVTAQASSIWAEQYMWHAGHSFVKMFHQTQNKLGLPLDSAQIWQVR